MSFGTRGWTPRIKDIRVTPWAMETFLNVFRMGHIILCLSGFKKSPFEKPALLEANSCQCLRNCLGAIRALAVHKAKKTYFSLRVDNHD